jgi:LysR family glycine cleavage system transcriptional activator
MLEPELERGRLVRPFTQEVPLSEAFHLLTPQHGGTHPDAALFRDWLLDTARTDHWNQRNREAQRA